MVMRVGGIVSGMDIEAMVNKLMEAERMPLNRLKQQQTLLTWKRDAYRDINNKLLDLDNMLLDMKLTRTYNPKTVSSSQANAITATAASTASNGTYEIEVSQLATRAMRVGESIASNENSQIDSAYHNKTITFKTYNENGSETEHIFTINEGDTIKDVLKKIETESDGRVRAFFEPSQGRVVLEATRTGIYNVDGNGNRAGDEIVFGQNQDSQDFFTIALGLTTNETEAKNATFKYNNGLDITSRENTYTLNGITFDFHNVTDGNARLTVNTNVDEAFNSIMNFVNKYNEAIDVMNKSQTEEKFRDYLPLLDEQKEEMSEDQIKLWEERAKSGILRGESSIRDGMYALRRSLQDEIATGGAYTLLSQIGIKTTMNYMDGGKLEVDEDKLKAALRDNPDDVHKLFSNSAQGAERGLINRFEDALDQVRGKIENQAGKSTQTLDNYALGKRMKELNERIDDFEKRMVRVEQRYWSQFTAMEKAIARLSEQSSYLFSQFGGGM